MNKKCDACQEDHNAQLNNDDTEIQELIANISTLEQKLKAAEKQRLEWQIAEGKSKNYANNLKSTLAEKEEALEEIRIHLQKADKLTRIQYFKKNWKIGVHLILRTKRFGVNNQRWSTFDSLFGRSNKEIFRDIVTIKPILENYRQMRARAGNGMHFLCDEDYKLVFGHDKNFVAQNKEDKRDYRQLINELEKGQTTLKLNFENSQATLAEKEGALERIRKELLMVIKARKDAYLWSGILEDIVKIAEQTLKKEQTNEQGNS